ncbi:MAG TPA: M1 family aminopeptidase [Gemmatimonadales bacterium]|nr:M1 family aminopeptidase [Gemmatimonadales bacterium]
MRSSLIAARLLLGVPLVAQSNAERILSEADTPSRGYDLLHQRIEVADFDWDSTAFNGKVTTTGVALRDGLDAVRLDAGRLLEVRRVTGPGRVILGFERPGDTLVVRLAHPAAFGDTVRFTVEYRGRVRGNRGLFFIPGDERGGRQVYSGGGTDGNPNWIPTQAAPDDKATWDLIATVPAALTVVSNGRRVSDRRAGRTRTVHWAQEQPASTYLLSLAAAPLARLADRWRGVPVESYVYAADTAIARQVFAPTPDIIDVYSRLTGVRYPWPRYAQVTVAGYFGGMENVTATTLADWLPDARAFADRPWYRRVLLPHEVAHSWFGNYVTTENWANYWLNEGFAQFMSGQYWEAKLGRRAEDDFYLDDYGQYLATDGRRRMPLASLGSNNVYAKGSLVLRMLKYQLGPERFWAGVRRYLTRHAFGNATSDDLRDAIREATGENLAWFFDQWVYGAGHPEFVVTAAYDSAARALTLGVRQTQPDTLPADSTGRRFRVAEAFRCSVTVRVGTAAGDVVRELEVGRREETVTVDRLAGAPTMVVFDDGNRILKTLTFKQPTAWLATQLARDPDVWNRSWVIRELAARPADTLAGEALVRAVQEADWSAVRARAAAALGRFPQATALPALETALRDTSARVREAAVAALAGVGGPRAAELARRAFERDTSYAVRAAAVAAATSLDSVGARDLVAAAVRQRSYQHVIQTAALEAAVELGDPTLVPVLEESLADQRLVALALGALAARGLDDARRALERHRDDPRPRVRGWVAAALRGGRASGP